MFLIKTYGVRFYFFETSNFLNLNKHRVWSDYFCEDIFMCWLLSTVAT